MSLKSYGGRHGIWVGWGPQSEKTSFITRTWLKTVFPPYMNGVGVNFSVGQRSFRIGTYKVIAGYVSSDYDDGDVGEDLTALGWELQQASPEVIGTWVSSTPSESTTSETQGSLPPPLPSPDAPEIEPSVSTPPHSSTGPSPSP